MVDEQPQCPLRHGASSRRETRRETLKLKVFLHRIFGRWSQCKYSWQIVHHILVDACCPSLLDNKVSSFAEIVTEQILSTGGC